MKATQYTHSIVRVGGCLTVVAQLQSTGRSVAEYWGLKPELSWGQLPVTAGFFNFLYFRLITSKSIFLFIPWLQDISDTDQPSYWLRVILQPVRKYLISCNHRDVHLLRNIWCLPQLHPIFSVYTVNVHPLWFTCNFIRVVHMCSTKVGGPGLLWNARVTLNYSTPQGL